MAEQSNLSTTSTPTLSEFDPRAIPFQYEVIKDVRKNYDYTKGTHEILLSGSVGSAKSILMAHLVITHCCLFAGARVGIGRLSMPALKGTIFATILAHLNDLVEVDINETQAIIKFPNGSEIRSFSWQDRKFMKVRSFEFSAFAIEELTESPDFAFYDEIFMRVGRLTHVPEKWICSATNPDGPEHPAYDRFIGNPTEKRHVYYSKTEDNPFLPKSYIEDLKSNLDPKMARRMLYGEWIEVTQDVVYHSYNERNNIDASYEVKEHLPIFWAHDFNIGEGKPMSSVFFQYYNDRFHFYDEIIVHGARTGDICEEALDRGIIKPTSRVMLCGDATGRSRDTRSIKSDYDILEGFLDKVGVVYESLVPLSNPPVRRRHNTVNSYMLNANEQRRLFVYKDCPTLHKGFRLTKLKSGGNYIEDDSKEYQHCTTAAGYGIMQTLEKVKGGANMQALDTWDILKF